MSLINFICQQPSTDVSDNFIGVKNLKLYQLKRFWKNGFGIWKIKRNEENKIVASCFDVDLIEYTKELSEEDLLLWIDILNQLTNLPTDEEEKYIIEQFYKNADIIIKKCEIIKYLESLTPEQLFRKCCVNCNNDFKNYCAFFILKGKGIIPKEENYAISKIKLINNVKDTFSNYPVYILGAYNKDCSIEENEKKLELLYNKLKDKRYDVIKYPSILLNKDERMEYTQYQLLVLGNYKFEDFEQENELVNLAYISKDYKQEVICYKPIYYFNDWKSTELRRNYWNNYGVNPEKEETYKKITRRGIVDISSIAGYKSLQENL